MTHHNPSALFAAALAALAGLTASACVHDVSDPEGHGDDAPELNFVGDEIADRFVSDDDGLLVSPPLSATAPANQVALMGELSLVASNGIDSEELPVVFVRAVGATEWIEAEWTFVETNGESTLVAGRGLLDGEHDAVEVAIDEDAAEVFAALTFSPAFIDLTDSDIDAVSSEQSEALAAELAYVGVVPRNVWGARAHRCSTRDNGYSRVALHHSAANTSSDAFAAARQIQAYHMDGRGYCDAGYHFAIARDGRVLELRPLPFRGGHTLNNNANNVGVVFLGCFHGSCGNQQPTEELLASGGGMLVMMNLLYGVDINSDRVRGHRDHSGAQTACPGDLLYPRLGEMRQRALDQINGGGGGGGGTPTPAPPPPSGCGIVAANAALAPGQGTHSCSGRFHFVHQTDGNVVLYDNGAAIWHTGTNGRSTSTLAMQGDGNVVLYSGGGQALWSTGTNGHAGAVLAVQDDGNVVVYAGSTALWNTGTNR